MKFDPSTWQLQVGRKWRHNWIPDVVFTENERTYLKESTGELMALSSSSGLTVGYYCKDLETIDEDQGEDQPAPTVDMLSSLWEFSQKKFDYMKERERETFELIVKSETQALTQQEFSKISSFDREWLIYSTLQSLIKTINTMAENQSQLDSAVAALGPILTQLGTDIGNTLTALQTKAASGEDFTSEVTTLSGYATALQNLDASALAANPTITPAPTPAA